MVGNELARIVRLFDSYTERPAPHVVAVRSKVNASVTLGTIPADARLLPELREFFRGWEEAVAQRAIRGDIECRRFAMIAGMSTVGHQAGSRVQQRPTPGLVARPGIEVASSS